MTEGEWLACNDPERMVQFLGSQANDRKNRLFLCACCRRIWKHLRAKGRKAVVVAERFADGKARVRELYKAARASYSSARIGPETPGAPGEENAAGAATEACKYQWRPEDYPLNPLGCRMASAAVFRSVIDSSQVYKQQLTSEGQQKLERAEPFSQSEQKAWDEVKKVAETKLTEERSAQAQLIRCIYNPFFSQTIGSAWLTWRDATVPKLAQTIYDERAFARLPILADALEEAGCADAAILDHCREPGPHVRGCWVVDLLLGKE